MLLDRIPAMRNAQMATDEAWQDKMAQAAAVRTAERQRDAIDAKERQRQQLQRSIERLDSLIRLVESFSDSGRSYRQQRDALLDQRSKL